MFGCNSLQYRSDSQKVLHAAETQRKTENIDDNRFMYLFYNLPLPLLMINPVFQGKEGNCKVTEKMVKIQNVDLVIISSSKYEICSCISLEFELFRRISVPYRHIKVSRSLKFD